MRSNGEGKHMGKGGGGDGGILEGEVMNKVNGQLYHSIMYLAGKNCI